MSENKAGMTKGILSGIRGVKTSIQQTFDESKGKGTREVVDVSCSLEILIEDGDKKVKKIRPFPGLVYPDSIGHKVSYQMKKVGENKIPTEFPITEHFEFLLIDEELNRTYKAVVKDSYF